MPPYPPLVQYPDISSYQRHFEREYCQGLILTFDAIPVRFKKQDFYHAFYESVTSKDDTFSTIRAERIDWIKATLQDSTCDLFEGWDRINKKYDNGRRVAVAMTNYVVVISINSGGGAKFITAYVANTPSTIQRIMQSPRWQ